MGLLRTGRLLTYSRGSPSWTHSPLVTPVFVVRDMPPMPPAQLHELRAQRHLVALQLAEAGFAAQNLFTCFFQKTWEVPVGVAWFSQDTI